MTADFICFVEKPLYMGFFAPFRYTELQCIAHKVQKGVTMGIVTGTKKNSDMELIKGYIQGKENGKRAEEACMRTIEKIASSVYNLMMVDRNLEPLKNFVTECQEMFSSPRQSMTKAVQMLPPGFGALVNMWLGEKGEMQRILPNAK